MANLDPQFAVTPYTYPQAQELSPSEALIGNLTRPDIVRLFGFDESQTRYMRGVIKVAYASGKFDGLIEMAKVGVSR